VSANKLRRVEAMLITQAHTLDALSCDQGGSEPA
jgi:hypothetical protein